MIQLPGFPPAYHTSTLAFDIGWQFLSNTRPLRKIAVDGLKSWSGAICLATGAPFAEDGNRQRLVLSFENKVYFMDM